MNDLPNGVGLLLGNDIVQRPVRDIFPDIDLDAEQLLSAVDKVVPVGDNLFTGDNVSDIQLEAFVDFSNLIETEYCDTQPEPSLEKRLRTLSISPVSHVDFSTLDVNVDQLIQFQRDDNTLDQCFKMAHDAASAGHVTQDSD